MIPEPSLDPPESENHDCPEMRLLFMGDNATLFVQWALLEYPGIENSFVEGNWRDYLDWLN